MSELNIPLTVVDNNQVVGMEVGAGVINAVSPTVDLERVSTPNPGVKVTVTDVRGEHSETVLDGPAGDPSALIDDTSTAADKVLSAQKVSGEITTVKNALRVFPSTAEAEDVGKYLKVKTVEDGKPTEYEYGTPSGGGGTSDYTDLSNKPSINGVTLTGNKSASDIGVASETRVYNIENLVTSQQTYTPTFQQGTYDEETGAINTSSTNACCTDKVNVKAGDTLTFNRSVNKISTTAYLAIFDADGTYIERQAKTNGTTVTFDSNKKIAIIAILNSTVQPTMQEAISAANGSFSYTLSSETEIVKTVKDHEDRIDDIEETLDDLSGIIELSDIIVKSNGVSFTQSTLSTGKYYSISSGKVNVNNESSAKYCALVDVSSMRGKRLVVHMNTRRSGSSRAFGFCDENMNVGSYKIESNMTQVADGSYIAVLLVDKDYMFFSCSSDASTISVEIKTEYTFVEQKDFDFEQKTKKYYHFSFDDVVLCLKDLTTHSGTYTSIFDNEFLAWCKMIHDKYGTTFSLYCYYEDVSSNPTWDLEDCTNAFAADFKANASWLKFGYHAYNSNSTATSREATAADDYDDFVEQIVRITGTVECIDRVPRLHAYTGTLTALAAMRDCSVGPVGYIASADTDLSTPRDSYYFTQAENDYIYKHGYMHDSENFLHFVKTSYLWISSNVSTIDKENGIDYFDINRYVEIFVHEADLSEGYKSSYEGKVAALSYSHKPYFLMDLVNTN